MHDLHNNIVAKRCILPQAIGTTGIGGGKLGKIVDRQGFDGVEFIFSFGSLTATNATIIPVMYEGDVTGTMTSVADADMVPVTTPEVSAGVAQAATRTSGVSKNFVGKVGYKGLKRYVNVRLYSTVTAGPIVDAVAILFNPEVLPTTVAQALAQ
jgi:hypothetical protein